MFLKRGVMALTCAAVVFGLEPAQAQNNGGIVLDIMREIIKQGGQRQQATPNRTRRTGISSAQRQQNRDVQSALNAFGYNVGLVDGSLGPKSRRAIGDFQAYMGMNPTGRLNDYERSMLLDSWRRYNAGGGQPYQDVIAREGMRGLPKAFNDPYWLAEFRKNNGGTQHTPQLPETEVARVNPQPTNPQPTNPQPGGNFVIPPIDLGGGEASVATYCELISGLMQANGGPTMPNVVRDPEQALGEQFCEARSFAITESQSLLSRARQSEDKMAGLCEQVSGAMSASVAGLENGDPKFVVGKAQEIANGLFKRDMGAAASYGKICLGIGYRRDQADIALAGATVLVAAGQGPYGEMLGHHLRQGFATVKSAPMAKEWYLSALSAMEKGAPPVFVPSKTAERNQIIRTAIGMQPGALEAITDELPLPLPALDLD